jgi:hypothetical protein
MREREGYLFITSLVLLGLLLKEPLLLLGEQVPTLAQLFGNVPDAPGRVVDAYLAAGVLAEPEERGPEETNPETHSFKTSNSSLTISNFTTRTMKTKTQQYQQIRRETIVS